MMKVSERLYTVAQVRELDRLAIEEHGIPGYVLMQRAGQATFRLMKVRYPKVQRLRVYCGSGNNGGDGFVIAALAREAGIDVELVLTGSVEKVQGDARQAMQVWCKAGGEILPQSTASPVDIIVDALLGTGLTRTVQGKYRALIREINANPAPVVAVDVPSGLCADRGISLEEAVEANLTVTYIGMKQGLLTANAPDFTGDLLFDDLAVPEAIYAEIEPQGQVLAADLPARVLPPRRRSSHKGSHGHVLVVGGNKGYAGAPRMTAMAAARAGAGLVSLITHPDHVAGANVQFPEMMVRAADDCPEDLLEKADCIAIGPGLGTDDWGQALLQQVLSTQKPLVLDADALNLLAMEQHRKDHWVLTPHPGEAARLLGQSTVAIQRDRFAAVKTIQQHFAGVCVLKGAGTLIYDGQQLALCCDGNPGMAVAGMGDVLTGIIASLLAQGLSAVEAARAGVLIHARAGDQAAGDEPRGLLASDLFPWIRQLCNP